MAIFNSYVSLPEGIPGKHTKTHGKIHPSPPVVPLRRPPPWWWSHPWSGRWAPPAHHWTRGECVGKWWVKQVISTIQIMRFTIYDIYIYIFPVILPQWKTWDFVLMIWPLQCSLMLFMVLIVFHNGDTSIYIYIYIYRQLIAFYPRRCHVF